jgi:phosphoglycolate phosphatase-like HAD superfamily hydrolase
VTGGDPTLRIAFDMDGVLADMHAALALEAERMFDEHQQSMVEALEDALEHQPPAPPAVARPDSASHFPLTAQHTAMLWQRVAGTENFWETLAETEPGIVARLARLAEDRRWEVLFITQRPPTRGATVQKQTQAWLRRHGYDFPSVCTTRGSRGANAMALDLDVVVDDRFEGCADVVDDSHARAMLVWRQLDEVVASRARRLGITVVHSVGTILDFLDTAEAPPFPCKPGLMRRLRQALRRT